MSDASQKPIARLAPGGNLSLDRSSGLRIEIVAAMESSPLVILDLSAVEDIDLSCLQVLYAARRGARESGRQFDLTGRLRPRLVSRLRSTGFISTEVETGEELEQALSFFKGAET